MINKERLIKTFVELVKIDSPTGEEDAVAKILISKLKALGFSVETDSFGNVIGKLKGTGEPFMLNAHMDTVEPGRGIQPIVGKDLITSDGATILGGDPKAGVSIILEAIESLQERKVNLPNLEVVFTRSEEVGLLGAVNLDYSKVASKTGLTFDGDDAVTNATISAPGYNKVDVIITGIGAHAGVEPEKGLSAIKIAAEIISELEVGRIDFETTANIGLISGGSARNAVPESVEIKAEVRSRNLEKLASHSQKFQAVFDKAIAKYPTAKIDLKIEREFDPYPFKKTHKIIEKVQKVMKKMNLEAVLHESGGGTDVNIFHQHGIEAIVMGTAVYDAHTKRENVRIPELIEATEFLINFLTS